MNTSIKKLDDGRQTESILTKKVICMDEFIKLTYCAISNKTFKTCKNRKES